MKNDSFHDAFKEPVTRAISMPGAIGISEPEKNPLSEAQKGIEESFRSYLQKNAAAAWRSYCDLRETAGGSIVNVDAARWLCSEYSRDGKQDEETRKARTLYTSATYQPAKDYCNRAFEAIVKNADAETPVIFTSGGPASGKSMALRIFLRNGDVDEERPIVYDTSFASLKKARDDIALCGDRKVRIVYVGCDFDEAMSSMIERSNTPGSDYGRYISAPRMVRLHSEALITAKNLVSELSNDGFSNKNVQLSYFMRRGQDVEQLTLDNLREKPTVSQEELAHVANRILDQKRDRIPGDLFAAIRGDQASGHPR